MTIINQELKPNTIIQYKGGGYDGCWWEWNYAYISSDRVFNSIWHSGRKGCETAQDMLDHLIKSCVDLGKSGKDPHYGHGLVNPNQLLAD